MSIKRVKSIWERGLSWMILTFTLGVLSVLVFKPSDQETPTPWTEEGLITGGLATLCFLIVSAYSARRRGITQRGNTMVWLWAHIMLGVLAVYLTLLHVGTGFDTLKVSSGWILLISLVLLTLTGLIWRLSYLIVPRLYQRIIRNYSAQNALDRAEIKRREMEKLMFGQRPVFQEMVNRWLGGGEVPRLLSSEESEIIEQLKELKRSRDKHIARVGSQHRAHYLLQIWRVFHVPLAFLALFTLPIHIIMSTSEFKSFNQSPDHYESAEECGRCHKEIYHQWSTSMHAFALMSPLTIALTYADLKHGTLGTSPEVQAVCVNCHGPLAARISGDNDPLKPLEMSGVGQEGINCVVCHQNRPKPETFKHQTDSQDPISALGSWREYWEGLSGGREYLTFNSAPSQDANNLYHQVSSHQTEFTANPSGWCASCHNVHIDRNGDQRITTGGSANDPSSGDLILQSVYRDWRIQGNGVKCMECHGGHGFTGVDYPLDRPDVIEETRSHRQALLSGVIALDLKPIAGATEFTLNLTNVKVAHSIPSGFAFARQLWLEFRLIREGREVFSSGVIEDDATDLCDPESMSYPIREGMKLSPSCPKEGDSSLLNLQLVLMSDTGEETVMQYAAGSPRPRLAVTDRCSGPFPIPLGKTLSCKFSGIPKLRSGDEFRMRFRFRNLPPYFLRRLDIHQDKVKLTPMIENLETLDILSRVFYVP